MDVVFVVSKLVDVLLFFQFICFRRCASCVLMLICLCFHVACFIFIIIFLVLCPFPFYTASMQVTRLQVILSGHEYLACRCFVQDDMGSSPASWHNHNFSVTAELLFHTMPPVSVTGDPRRLPRTFQSHLSC